MGTEKRKENGDALQRSLVRPSEALERMRNFFFREDYLDYTGGLRVFVYWAHVANKNTGVALFDRLGAVATRIIISRPTFSNMFLQMKHMLVKGSFITGSVPESEDSGS